MRTLEELREQAIQELKDNDELFVACVNELDSWNGYADGFRAYPMYELDELHCGVSLHDFLYKLTSDFDIRDEYFYYSIYGLESTDSIEELYRENVWESELLDNLIDNYSNLDINWIDSDFDELLESIVNYDQDIDIEEAFHQGIMITSVNIKDLATMPETTTETETITA